jgi:spermidine synthase
LRKDLPAFLLGLVATAFQVLLLREFSAYLSGNELTLGIILASWLLWVGLGSLAAGRLKSPPVPSSFYFLVLFLFPFALSAVRFCRFLFHLVPGEIVGLLPVTIMSLGLCGLIGLPLGALFVLNVNRQAGDIGRVYILECLGAVAAGPVVYLLLPLSGSSWATAAILSGAVGFSLLWTERRLPVLAGTIGLTVLLSGFWLADLPSQRAYWKPFELIATRDTRYSRLQLIQTQGQFSLYSNTAPVYSLPDPGAAEEAVHFAMLQNPEAGHVLLIGGGAGGALSELLKYPAARIDYLELDPEIIRLSQFFLGDIEKGDLSADRVQIVLLDGRTFLQRTEGIYEAIILDLPEPSTAQLNRFYTLEFFRLARRHLTPSGVLSFLLPSSEAALGPDLLPFLSSVHATLSEVFPEVRVVPGERSVFLASAGPLTLESAEINRRIASLGLSTRFLGSRSIGSRLHPLRVRQLDDQLSTGPRRLNSDYSPVGFFLNAALWSSQFRGPGPGILRFFSKVSISWLLGLPLLLFALLLLVLRARRQEATFSLLPLALMGLTTIVAEIVLLVWFQALYGFLYGRIALLLSTFMLGLFLGALLSARIKSLTSGPLAWLQAGFLLLLVLFRLAIPVRLPEALAYVILLLLGLLGGGLFVVSNRLYLRLRKDYGRGYALDLFGSFFGALLTSSIFIPLAGLARVIESVIVLNAMGFLFLLTRPKKAWLAN